MPLIQIVANVATRVLSPNTHRTSYSVKNDSIVVVFRGYDRSVAVAGPNQGYLIAAGGDAIEDEFHKGEVWLIAAAGCNVTVEENTTAPWDRKRLAARAKKEAAEEAG
jgi:hypothetical protein